MTDQTASVTARMGTFPSARLENAARRRVVGRWQLLLWGVLPLGVLCGLVITVVAQVSSDGPTRLGIALVLGTAGVASIQAVVRLLLRKMRQPWPARGIPLEIDTTFSILPEGLQITSDVGVGMIRWRFISEVMPAHGHWLLVSVGYGFGIPRQSFSSRSEEHAFMTALLGHLEPAALTRSRKAEKLIASLA